jgi:hypothetical protein
MNCEDVRIRLIDYYEGELNYQEQNFLEGHLRKCKGCLIELDQFIYTLELILRSCFVPELPDVFWSQFTTDVLNRIRKEKEKTSLPWLLKFPRIQFNFAITAWAALLLFALGFLGYFGFVNSKKEHAPLPLNEVVLKREEPAQDIDIKTLVKMLQEDPQSDENMLYSLLGRVALDKVEDIVDYERVLLEVGSVFDSPEIDGTDAYIETVLKSLSEKEKEVLLVKLHNMI